MSSGATTSRRIVIVGGGIAGLASAMRLSQAGFPVTLFEASELGSAASTRNQAPGVGVGEVIQLLDGLPYPLHEPVGNRRRAVDGTRDGGYRNLRKSSDGADVWRLGDGFPGSSACHVHILKHFAAEVEAKLRKSPD